MRPLKSNNVTSGYFSKYNAASIRVFHIVPGCLGLFRSNLINWLVVWFWSLNCYHQRYYFSLAAEARETLYWGIIQLMSPVTYNTAEKRIAILICPSQEIFKLELKTWMSIHMLSTAFWSQKSPSNSVCLSRHLRQMVHFISSLPTSENYSW